MSPRVRWPTTDFSNRATSNFNNFVRVSDSIHVNSNIVDSYSGNSVDWLRPYAVGVVNIPREFVWMPRFGVPYAEH